MKLKSLLFGSAAVLAAGTGAQAADLPTVEPVEYVRICDAFGTGFYYIPGTDTCLRLSGRVRIESHYVDGDPSDRVFLIPGGSNVNNWTSRARGNIRLDARTQADIGLIRAFADFEMTVGHADSSLPDGIGGANYSGTNVALAAAFIQISNDWGTYTAGHSGSNFDFFGSNGYGSRIDIDDNTTEQTQFAWTFAGGNGFSFTIAAEDPASSGRRGEGIFSDDYEGQEAPDGVANIRVDQGWGSAQIMAVVHHINDVNGDGLGFAVGGGLSLGIPGGWTFATQGGYSEGAIRYLTNDPGSIGDFSGPDGDDTNEAWMVRAGITGPLFNPNLAVWVNGSFTHVESNNLPVEYDFAAAKVGAAYSLAPGLTVGPEVAWNNLDLDIGAGNIDEDVWGVMWRIQRDF